MKSCSSREVLKKPKEDGGHETVCVGDHHLYPDVYTFLACLYCGPDGVSIEFPDLPGCLPCAKNAEEAFRAAKEALGLHLYGMEQDGDEIPTPAPVARLHQDEGVVVAMIEVFMPSVRDRINNRIVKKH